MLQAGKLDQRITLLAPKAARGTSGGYQQQWEVRAECWAAVRHLSGNERAATKGAGGVVAVSGTEFITPWRGDVTERWAVLYRGQHYNIKHANDLMAKRETLILTCETGLNNA